MIMSIVAASHSLSTLAFFLLALLLLTSWRGRPHGAGLLLACGVSAVWAAAIATAALAGHVQSPLIDVLEVLRGAGWSSFLLVVLGQSHQDRNRLLSVRRLPAIGVGVFYMALLGLIACLYLQPALAVHSQGITLVLLGRIGTAVLNMLLVEQLYRNAPREARWAIKFACLGIGGLFAYDFYLYSDALLFRQISPAVWAARGMADALAVPLIAVSAARNPRWSTIAVSRSVLFHSVVVLGCALYLLVMAAVGYYLRLFGGTWGTVLQVAFLCGAGALMCAALFSGSLRAWIRVSISKHFYTYRYDYRQEWLRFTRNLSDAGPGLNERTIQALATLTESPSGALFIRRQEAGFCEPVTHWNLPAAHQTEPLDGSLCRYLESTQWVIDLHEATDYPDKYDGLVLPPWLVRMRAARLVVPLLLEGQLFGFVVLGEPRSKIKVNWEVIDLLKIAGTQAASYLAQRESQHALMVARQFESYTRMSTFIVHDLKNLISQLSLMLANAEKHRDNQEFQVDMLETVNLSVQKMRMLLQKLSRGPVTDSPRPVLLTDLLQQAIQLKSSGSLRPSLIVDAPDLVVVADRARLERVLSHLIQNAVEATSPPGTVNVRLRGSGEQAIVEVQDTGHGMTEEFIRDRLFKPFETTKAAGMGIGVFESRSYIRQLGGEIEVRSVPSAGTTFRVTLPLDQYNTGAALAA